MKSNEVFAIAIEQNTLFLMQKYRVYLIPRLIFLEYDNHILYSILNCLKIQFWRYGIESEKWLPPFILSIRLIHPIVFLSVYLFVFLYLCSFSFSVFSVSQVVPPYPGWKRFIND